MSPAHSYWGYPGSYSPVQRFVSELKKSSGTDGSDAFIPLYFAPGDALQFDWSEEYVLLGGVEHKVHVAHFRLCHSRKPFVVAYMNEKQVDASSYTTSRGTTRIAIRYNKLARNFASIVATESVII